MERAKEDRLEKLKEQGKNIYSISRLNSLSQCHYSAYITYVLGIEVIVIYGQRLDL